MSKFKTLESREELQVQKMTIGGWEGPVVQPQPPESRFEVQKAAAGEKELGLGGQVEQRNIDGDVQELSRRIAQICRRVAAPTSGVHTPTTEERRSIRDQIIAGMTAEGIKPTPELKAIAALLAGLKDDLPAPGRDTVQKSALAVTSSPEFREFQRQFVTDLDKLGKRLTDLLAQRANRSRFQTGPVQKDAAAQAELRKALANGQPAHFDGEGIQRSGFRPVESVAPGVQMHSNPIPVATEVRKRSKFEPL